MKYEVVSSILFPNIPLRSSISKAFSLCSPKKKRWQIKFNVHNAVQVIHSFMHSISAV